MSKTALICGVGGQDGSYLARLLLGKGYVVYGTTRHSLNKPIANLVKLGISNQVQVIQLQPDDQKQVLEVMSSVDPDEVYFLAGESSVAISFVEPAMTIEGIIFGTLNLLEACRKSSKKVRLFNAGSAECFGNTGGLRVTEDTPLVPLSPYAIAKTAACSLVKQYRNSYDLYVCTGMLFNHESPLRPAHFVTQKIIQAVNEIVAGRQSKLSLGHLDIARDWGWAPEYVEAMWLMLQQDTAEDFVIATGTTITLKDFVDAAFKYANLDWQSYVVQDPAFLRPTDLLVSRANIDKISNALGWQPTITGTKVVEKMFEPI
jgi:GDPmannose 4,6-dehydratase